ncbi:FAD-dependent thymidylate synthase [Desulfobulbus rhabdoformis]|uniref:FAD-dependent thymidylate synthase n=1 Tax=Desulfobulbus rhabdoformis TaxID=34032 RepID=UPI0019629CEF|nr:FAD-dependent thymidylate synthase [Desulfobulbus rhabdoformis]MBM9615248.1 FAD-dependent thymidylate synthase [Desulfobulbus rhabdoformis]
MKIVEPYAKIIESELEQLSVYQRIDKCASVCYQRPEKPNDEEARVFCLGIVDRKHWMPLEMAVVHLATTELDVPKSKYITSSRITGETRGKVVISGSIRAFLEAEYPNTEQSLRFLAHEFPLFFGEDIRDTYVKFARPDQIPWYHKHVAVRIVTNRAISHQLVRHRPCAILQESQRFCRYDGERFDGEVSFVRPGWVSPAFSRGYNPLLKLWRDDMMGAERRYFNRLDKGLQPQQARGVLPNECKTELIMYASLPEWLHILNTDTMRCSKHADPEMRRIMIPLREEFMAKYPEADWSKGEGA